MNKSNQTNLFFISKIPTPVFNTPNISDIFGGKDGSHLRTDDKGHIRALEFIALPNTIFKLIETIYLEENNLPNTSTIYKVQTKAYPKSDLYIDSRFVKKISKKKIIYNVNKNTFPKNVPLLIKKLNSFLGLPYLWGGNWAKGIPELLKYYPPINVTDNTTLYKWSLQGVDCSGLLYELTKGFTPRNTSDLFHFGRFLKIDNFSINQIIKKIKPLDLIIFPGHVIIIKSKSLTIEAREFKGVIQTPIKERLTEIMLTKKPSSTFIKNNNFFVIKRWF